MLFLVSVHCSFLSVLALNEYKTNEQMERTNGIHGMEGMALVLCGQPQM